MPIKFNAVAFDRYPLRVRGAAPAPAPPAPAPAPPGPAPVPPVPRPDPRPPTPGPDVL